jgi:hypothetical protein
MDIERSSSFVKPQQSDNNNCAGGAVEEGRKQKRKSSPKSSSKSCGETEVAATTTTTAVKKRKIQVTDWAPIRMKLGARITAQMEGGVKLSLKTKCSQKCAGPDQNVFLYRCGMQKLLQLCSEMTVAMHHNQHYSTVLEVRMDMDINRVDFVVALVVSNKMMLINTEIDMLGVIGITGATTASAITSAIVAAGITESSTPIGSQTVSLTVGGFKKLQEFIINHADPAIFTQHFDSTAVVKTVDASTNTDITIAPTATTTTTNQDDIEVVKTMGETINDV